MPNSDLDHARQYHEATKHSYWSVRNNPHFLDWPNQPLPFKIYTNLKPIPLPAEIVETGMPALNAIATRAEEMEGAQPELNPAQLGRLFYLAGGITRRRESPAGEIYFRAASCTGALYEIEIYLVCQDLPGLAAGVYHWNPLDHALRRLREGDCRRVVHDATAAEPAVREAPAVVLCSASYWRNAWKYQARTYRHFGWDNGTLLANLLAAAAAAGIPAKLVMGFADEPLNHLLGLDTEKEVVFSMVSLGRGGNSPAEPPALEPLRLATQPLSAHEVDYPAMRTMHEHSSLRVDEVRPWRGAPPPREIPETTGKRIPLRQPPEGELPADSLEAVIQRRGSSRQFAREPISFEQFSVILERSTRGVPADFLEPCGSRLNDLYLIVHAVEGLAAGAYFFHGAEREIELLRGGEFRAEAGYLGLEQQLPADGSFCIFYLADLDAVSKRFGNRGYRAAQTEAGILGGKVYLAAYAQRLGATGLTFYDDEVVKYFSPHAEGKSVIFLMVVGKRRKSS